MEYQFCPVCSHELTDRLQDDRIRRVCRGCGFIFYQNPTPAAAVVLIENDLVLLVKRKYEPKAGDWSLPAGFIEYDESPSETAIRETKEETGLDTEPKRIAGIFQRPATKEGNNITIFVFKSDIISGKLTNSETHPEVGYFSYEEIKDLDGKHLLRSPYMIPALENYLNNRFIEMSALKIMWD